MSARGFFALPHLSRRTWTVWRRNRDVFTKTIMVNFVPPIAEPIIYLVAIGFGIGAYTSQGSHDFSVFIAPGLIAITIMTATFFECTFASFVSMYFQKTFDAIVATPLNVDEVIAGEMLWGATRSTISAIIILTIVALFGLVNSIWILLAIPFSFLGGLMFAAMAMCFTAITPKIENLNYPTSLFITPMMFVSGTFFEVPAFLVPVENAIVPLYHVTRVTRSLAEGTINIDILWSLLWILVVTAIFFLLAINLMKRRLII